MQFNVSAETMKRRNLNARFGQEKNVLNYSNTVPTFNCTVILTPLTSLYPHEDEELMISILQTALIFVHHKTFTPGFCGINVH